MKLPSLQIVRYQDLRLKRSDGQTVGVDVIGNPYRVGLSP